MPASLRPGTVGDPHLAFDYNRLVPRILVVEDDATTRDTLALNLRAEGYEVFTSGDGEEGLRQARDPIATLRIEELMRELSADYTIVIVTHNMQQAARVSDYTAMMMLDRSDLAGMLIEFDDTDRIFTRPKDQRTEDYVTGRFG